MEPATVSGVCIRMIRLAFVIAYLAGTAAAVVLFDANNGDGELALAIWALASVLLGWGSGSFGLSLLAFLAIPFAIPFGYPNDYAYSEPMPIWWTVAVCSLFSAGLVFLTALAKRIAELRRRRPSP